MSLAASGGREAVGVRGVARFVGMIRNGSGVCVWLARWVPRVGAAGSGLRRIDVAFARGRRGPSAANPYAISMLVISCGPILLVWNRKGIRMLKSELI